MIQAIHKHNIQGSRYTLIDQFEPTNNTSLKLFTDKVKQQLYGYYIKPQTICIELSWNSVFEDLDLELEVKIDNSINKINYSYMEFKDHEMIISLNKDIQKYEGSKSDDKEIIKINNFKDYDYKVRVTKFSNEENFHESDAVVVIREDNNRIYKTFNITKGNTVKDNLWNVFSFKTIDDLI